MMPNITISLSLFIASIVAFAIFGFVVGIAYNAHKQDQNPTRLQKLKAWRRIFRTQNTEGKRAKEAVYSVLKLYFQENKDAKTLAEAISVADYFGFGLVVAEANLDHMTEQLSRMNTNGKSKRREEQLN